MRRTTQQSALVGLFFCAYLLIGSNSYVSRSSIALTSNGYEGVLVAIGEDVREDRQIITELQELFEEASQKLFVASKRRAYFRNVTILVPMSWSRQKEYGPATNETFDKANIVIDIANEEFSNNPYVKQIGGCGKGGEFMHITPDFLLEKEASRAKFGDLGKVIIHEWGHLRWGLFDEYPLSQQEQFYQSAISGNVEATRCSMHIQGQRKNRRTGAPCKINSTTSLPESDCRFYPKDSGLLGSSYMYYNHLDSVVEFCDNDSRHAEHFHNAEAPNLHNKLCGGKSAWEVMREHVDFAHSQNLPVQNIPEGVSFKLVQRSEYTAVVVMDISGSMSSDNYYIKLNTAVKNFILNVVPRGSLIGLVEFDSTAKILTPTLRVMNTSQDRSSLAAIVPMKYVGGTSIGSGMLAALQLLTAGGRNAKGSFIIVVSDGAENENPRIATAQPQLLANGVIVDTVLFGQNADRALITLAEQSGGVCHYYSGDEASMSLIDAFSSMVATREGNTAETPISIISQVLALPGSTVKCQQATIDISLRKDTKFILSWSSNYAFRAAITSPSKNFSATVTSSTNMFASTTAVPDLAEVGKWNVCITSLQSSTISVGLQVEAKATAMTSNGQDAPITVAARASTAEARFIGTNIQPLAIYATVTRGYSPVIHADVEATIEGPRKGVAKETLYLLDDGSGADITKDDGTYSSFYLDPTVLGDHTIQIRVEGDDSAKVKVIIGGSRAPVIDAPGAEISEAVVVLDDTGSFQRVASGGFFTVKSLPPAKQDIYPPSRIADLTVTAASYEDQLVQIQFTAVGDDFDRGNASSYELRYAWSFDDIFYGFDNATRIHQKDVVIGNLSAPSPSHELESISFRVVPGELIVIGIKAVDEAGNKGPLSNIVTARPSYVSNTELPSESASSWKIACGSNTFQVTIPGNNSDETYYFYGSTCRFGFNGSEHEASVPLGTCGLKERRSRNGVTYYGYVVRAPSDADIFDDELQLVNVECAYKVREINSSQTSFDTQAKVDNSNKETVQGSPATNVTSVSLLQYPDSGFTRPYASDSYPLEVKLGASLFFQLKALGQPEGVELAVINCKAFGGQDKEHYLVRDGCVVSKSLQFLPAPFSYEKRFTLRSFSLVGSEGPVFMECQVKVCDQGYGQCGGCSNGTRSKRQLAAEQLSLIKVNIGPITAIAHSAS